MFSLISLYLSIVFWGVGLFLGQLSSYQATAEGFGK